MSYDAKTALALNGALQNVARCRAVGLPQLL